MSIFESSYCGSIWHHGIKGQKWGVRRTPEQLGYEENGSGTVAKSDGSAKIIDGVYYSAKGFTCAVKKLAEYCLKPGAKHSQDFFDVGYSENDADTLFSHLEQGFDLSRKRGAATDKSGAEKFSIPMMLGITAQRTFNTAWRIDQPGSAPRFISGYRMDRLKEDD